MQRGRRGFSHGIPPGNELEDGDAEGEAGAEDGLDAREGVLEDLETLQELLAAEDRDRELVGELGGALAMVRALELVDQNGADPICRDGH